METLIIFIGLKIAEIVGIGLFCYSGYYLTGFIPTAKGGSWITRSILGVLIIALIGFILALLGFIVIMNWQWAVRLTN